MPETTTLATSVVERFLNYVTIDTQSAEGSSTYPSTLKQLVLLDQLVTEIEEKRGMTVGHTKFLVMIETADAFTRIDEIPRASPRTVGMLIGGEDFALDLNAQPDDDVLLAPKARMAVEHSRINPDASIEQRLHAALKFIGSWGRIYGLQQAAISRSKFTPSPVSHAGALR